MFSIWEVNTETKVDGSLIEISFKCPCCNSDVKFIAKELVEILSNDPELSLEEAIAMWLL